MHENGLIGATFGPLAFCRSTQRMPCLKDWGCFQWGPRDDDADSASECVANPDEEPHDDDDDDEPLGTVDQMEATLKADGASAGEPDF